MKKIGLVGGTGPESTLIYYKELNRRINERSGGTDFPEIIIESMHIIYDMVAQKVHTPFISIPETAAEYTASKGYHRVGLLGTIFTMEKDYLSKAFIKRGIEVVVPDPATRVLVNERISKELEYGIVKEATVEELKHVILSMKNEHGIEAVILGCTELPLALNDENSPVPCIDIMEIHIDRLVELIR